LFRRAAAPCRARDADAIAVTPRHAADFAFAMR
jgi:hypothetical protein